MPGLRELATRIWLRREEARLRRDDSEEGLPGTRKRKRAIRWRIPFLSPALNLAIIIGGVAVVAGKAFVPEPGKLYPIERTLDLPDKRQLVIHDEKGNVFAHRGGCVDAPVLRAELPQHFIDALTSMEDRRFFYHIGIDPIGIARAMERNYRAGRIVEGGSTLTQQLAKQVYLTRDKTYTRKLKELVIVLRLELMLSKDQILERYLNAAYFGQGCYGLRAAARHYFQKEVKDLSVSESAYLVAVLPSPTKFAKNRTEAEKRQRLVLEAMVETGTLPQDQLASVQPAEFKNKVENVFGAYYADWIAQTTQLPDDGKTTPLPVHTSFDPKLQQMAEDAVAKIMKRSGKRKKASQAALVAMRPDGRIVAMVGGRDYGKSQFNRAFQAARQPGSAFKTFVYLAALRQGAEPQMTVWDEPISIGDWSPQNFGHNYRGPVSLQGAFAGSINTVAVRLSEAVGRENVVTAAHDLGITSQLQSTPSIALGTSEVNLVELTTAYAAISANAYPIKTWGVLGFDPESAAKAKPPEGAGEWRLMVGNSLRQMMASTVSHGTARGARIGIAAYGKTGTSQDFRDAWFVGFAGNLVVGVWVGNDDNSSMRGVTGGNMPATIWRTFMSAARKGDPKFKSRRTRVAAFQAKPRRLAIGGGAALASLLSSPYEQEQLYSDRYNDGGWWGGWFGGRRDRAELREQRRYRLYQEREFRRAQERDNRRFQRRGRTFERGRRSPRHSVDEGGGA